MSIADKLVLQRQHHLKWRAFDRLELFLMIVCGVLCFGFSLSVTADIVTRTIGQPLAVAAGSDFDAVRLRDLHRRRGRHTPQRPPLSDRGLQRRSHGTPRLVVEILIRVVVLAVAGVLIYYGYINYLRGFGSFRLP